MGPNKLCKPTDCTKSNHSLHNETQHVSKDNSYWSVDVMGIPPMDIYCSSTEIKFLIEAVNKDDLVFATHVQTLTRPSSLSSFLLSKLRRFERTHMSHSYTRDSIKTFIRDNWNRRWNSPYNDIFFRNFISNLPQETIHSPLLDGSPLIAIMISDLLIASSRRLAENLWKLSRTPSPCVFVERQSRTATTISFIVQIIVISDPFIWILLNFSSLMTVPLLGISSPVQIIFNELKLT